MARVLLVDPSGWQGAALGNRPFPNVGLAYLIPALTAAGHAVSLLDANNTEITSEAFVDALRDWRPDIVGLSAKTSTMNSTRHFAGLVRASLPDARVVLGGPHTTIAGAQLRGEPLFDTVFVGEGEEVFPALCEALAAGETPGDPAGTPGGDNSEAGLLAPPLIADLDGLRLPEYELFPPAVRDEVYRSYPLVTSRGCVYGCTYCSVPRISGHRFRAHSPGHVVGELQRVQADHGTRAFEIIDDTFNFDMDRCKAICHGLLTARLDMTWTCPNGLRADRLDAELAALMVRSGCRHVMLGIESADPAVLAAVHKGETLEQVETGIRLLQEAGIGVGGFFIIGLPQATYHSEELSVAFARRHRIGAHFNMLVPYPGTKAWEWVTQQATVLANVEDGLHFADSTGRLRPVFETADYSAAQRQQAYEMAATRMRQMEMVIPRSVQGLRRVGQELALLWRYDRSGVLAHALKRIMAKLRALVRLGG